MNVYFRPNPGYYPIEQREREVHPKKRINEIFQKEYPLKGNEPPKKRHKR